jgi:hypothetical protein
MPVVFAKLAPRRLHNRLLAYSDALQRLHR